MKNSLSFLEIIAIDHGNKDIKGEYGIKYEAGFVSSESEPIITSNMLEYEGKYYTVGTERFPTMINKCDNDKFFILTLPAIASTLKMRGIYEADICLVVGLPILYYSNQKEKFRDYFMRGEIEFYYEKIHYKVNIGAVLIFCQAYAGVLSEFNKYKEGDSVVVDLGSGTIDYFHMRKGILNISKMGSYNTGVINLVNEIKNELFKNDIQLEDSQIQDIIMGQYKDIFIKDSIVEMVNEKAELYIDKIFTKLKEDGYELKANKVIFLGGGSILLSRQISESKYLSNFEIMEKADFANVLGYKVLAKEKISKSF